MKKLALALFLVAVAGVCQAKTGNEILTTCGPVVYAMDNGTGYESGVDAGFCLGWVTGFVDSMQAVEAIADRRMFCFRQSTFGQGLRVLIKYLRAHPEDADEPATYSAMLAYAEAWPCAGDK